MEPKGFFKKHYIATAKCLDSKAAGMLTEHSGDSGELCELFIKEFLSNSFDGIARVFRGGNIIDSKGNSSEQIDIVISPINTLKIYEDKGLYPIEAVYGVFSVTKSLTKTKLFSGAPNKGGCIKNLKSISHLKSDFLNLFENTPLNPPGLDFHISSHPYKCVFSYYGDINSEWAGELNKMIGKDHSLHFLLPDLIIVNRKGYITKRHDEKKNAYFQYVNLKSEGNDGSPLIMLVHDLLLFLDWQQVLRTRYEMYFNVDLN